MERFPDQPTRIGVVSSGAVGVAGERVLYPERAAVAGICRVAPQEYPNLQCIHIDIDDLRTEVLVDAVLHETSHQSETRTVAYRRGERWLENIERHELEQGTLRLRARGVYLITGGLGGLGLAVSQWLARTYQARLVLVSRNAELHAELCKTELAEIEQSGGEVLILSADVSDPAGIREVVARARQRFGSVQGVIHAAGVLDDSIIARKTRAGAEAVLRPKINGTRVLVDQFAGAELDFIALFSSVSATAPPPGQVDYCAANAYLNAFAESRPPEANVFAIGWGAWDKIGMTARVKSPVDRAPHALLEQLEVKAESELTFSGSFSVKRDWFLREHRFRDGASLLPGTVHLELAAAIARKRTGHAAVELQNFVFREPFFAATTHIEKFQVRLQKSADGFGYSMTWAERVVAAGEIRAIHDLGSQRINLQAIGDRCQAGVVEFPRNVRQESHFEFGPHWRSVRQIAFGQQECLATLELDSDFQGEADSFWLHPALLDAATGAALYLVPGYDQPGDLYLPFSYRSVKVYRNLPSSIYVHIRASRPAMSDLAVFDITIADRDGGVLLEIAEFAFKRVDTESASQMAKASKVQGMSQPPGSSSGEATGAIFTQHDGLDALQQILRSRGGGVTWVSPHDLSSAHPSAGNAMPQPAHTDGQPGSTEAILQRMWGQVLGVESADLDSDFFGLGGHSLAALRLFTEIREHFGLDFGLATIFQARTIRALANLIDKQKRDTEASQIRAFDNLVAIQPGDSRPPLFCIHGVGGNVLNYQELAQYLGADQPVYGIQSRTARGLADDSSVEQMAAQYIEDMRSVQPEGPYFLCGQSFGGLIAYEIARQLKAGGQKAELVALVDTMRGEVRPSKRLKIRNTLRKYEELFKFHSRSVLFGADRLSYAKSVANAFRRRGRNFFLLRQARHFEQQYVQANWLAARNYKPGPYDGEVVLFRCKIRSPNDHWDKSLGWKPLVPHLRIIEVPGDHNSVLKSPNVSILAAELNALLSTASSAKLDAQLT